jgi:opacity protein-like surface antigen
MKQMRQPFGIGRRIPAALFALALTARAPAVCAEQGAIVSVNVAGTSIGEGVSAAVTGAFAYQLTTVVGLGVEVMWVPTLTPKVPGVSDIITASDSTSGFVLPTPVIRLSPDGGRAVIVSSNVRLQIPTTTQRLVPYVIAGGGVGTVREDITYELTVPLDILLLGLPMLPPIARSQSISHSFTDLALTLGGGVNIYTTNRLAIDVDLRYIALLGTRDLHIGRFGGGISYKF